MVQQREDPIQFVNREHFTDSGVVIQDRIVRVSGGIEVTHPGFRPADEFGIAEYNQRMFRLIDKAMPEGLDRRRSLGCYRRSDLDYWPHHDHVDQCRYQAGAHYRNHPERRNRNPCYGRFSLPGWLDGWNWPRDDRCR